MKYIMILITGILIGLIFGVIAYPNDPLCDSKLQYCEHTQEVAFEYGYKAGIEDCVD